MVNKENDIKRTSSLKFENSLSGKGDQSKKNAFLYQVPSPTEMPHLKPWNNTAEKELLKQSISTPVLVQSTFEFAKTENEHIVQQSSNFEVRDQSSSIQQEVLVRSKSHDSNLNQSDRLERTKKSKSAMLNLFSMMSKKDELTKSTNERSSSNGEEKSNGVNEQNIIQKKEIPKVKKIRVLKQPKIQSSKRNENSLEQNHVTSIKNPRAMQNDSLDIKDNSNVTNSTVSQIEIVEVHSSQIQGIIEKPSKNKFKKRTNVKIQESSAIKFHENVSTDEIEIQITNIIPEPSKREHTLPVPKKRSIVNIPKEELERIDIPLEIVKNSQSSELPSPTSTNEVDTWNLVARHRQNTRAIASAHTAAKQNYTNFYNGENTHRQMDNDISDDIIDLPETNKSSKPRTMREMKQFNMNNRIKNEEMENKEIKLDDRRRSEESDTEA